MPQSHDYLIASSFAAPIAPDHVLRISCECIGLEGLYRMVGSRSRGAQERGADQEEAGSRERASVPKGAWRRAKDLPQRPSCLLGVITNERGADHPATSGLRRKAEAQHWLARLVHLYFRWWWQI